MSTQNTNSSHSHEQEMLEDLELDKQLKQAEEKQGFGAKHSHEQEMLEDLELDKQLKEAEKKLAR
jgi:hypothetical protein